MESGCARVQIAWGPSSYKTQGVPSWMTSSGFSNCACALPIGVLASFEGARAPGHASNRSGRSSPHPASEPRTVDLTISGRGRETAPTKRVGDRMCFSGNRKPKTYLVSLVAFFFENGRAQRFVDAALERGALVVGLVHASGQLHEAVAEVAFALAVADFVFNIPEFFVEGFQFRPHAGYFGAFGGFSVPKAGEHVEFTLHVGALVRVVDALELDIQNRNLVQQLDWRNGYGDGFGHVFTTD